MSLTGAHFGFFAALLARQVGPEGRVVGFEPSMRIFAKLRATIARKRLNQLVKINVGCGSSTGDAVLRKPSAPGQRVEIPRLDEMAEARERVPRQIKIDVEGLEPEMPGARGILEQRRTVRCMELCGECGSATVRSAALLKERGCDMRAFSALDWPEVPNQTSLAAHPAGRAG